MALNIASSRFNLTPAFFDASISQFPQIRSVFKFPKSHKTLPIVFVNGKYLGGCDTLQKLKKRN